MTTEYQTAIAQKLNEVISNSSAEAITQYGRLDAELKERDIKNTCLKTGDYIPDFSLPDATGKTQNINKLHDRQWLVLTFYRGQWCPFCNIQLRALQKHIVDIENIPARLVAISPQLPDKSLSLVEKHQLKYPVLSDAGNRVGKQFGLVYKVPEYLQKVFEKDGLHLEYYNGNGNIELPLPATYIINKEGKIVYHYVEVSPSDRLDPELLVAELKKLMAN